MNMLLKEAFFLYQEEYAETDHKVSFSTLASLHPENVLLLNDSPKDQCKYKIHENFLLKLDAMGNKYNHEFWDTVLCDISPNSDCWLALCDSCKNGVRFIPKKQGSEVTNYRQWETVEKNNGYKQEEEDEGEHKKKVMKVLQCNSNKVFVGKVQEEFEYSFPELVNHINVKRIQAAEFQKEIEDPKKCVGQLDYAMSYQCE